MIETFNIFWSSPIELRVIILGAIVSGAYFYWQDHRRKQYGKVKEVEEEVVSLVKDGFNLRDIKLSLGYWADENPYMLNEKLIEQSFKKATRKIK